MWSKAFTPFRFRSFSWIALSALVLWVTARLLGWGAPWSGAASPTLLEAAYILAAAGVLGWLLGLGRGRGGRGQSIGEDWRRVSLAGLGVWLYRPFLHPEFFGGIDGRWYGYVMTDALKQARAGVFPLMVGQSEYVVNGSINPIRLAPYYQYFGVTIDVLTARALPSVAVQHLVVIATAVISALGCYFCLTDLCPSRRWLGWAFSALYVCAPPAMSSLYIFNLYLAFTAVAWIPLVLWANVKLVRHDDAVGWAWLAAGLALVWLSHAPLGGWITLVTLLVQGFRLVSRDMNGPAWWGALGGVLLFVGLTWFCFWSTAEAMTGGQGIRVETLGAGLALLAGCGALVRWLATRRWPWLAGAALIAAAAGRQDPWFMFAVPLAGVAGWAASRWNWLRMDQRLMEWAFGLFLLAGVFGVTVRPPTERMPALVMVHQLFPASLLPVSPFGLRISDMQLGYGLIAGLLLGVAAAIRRPTWENRMLAVTGLAVAAMTVPLPGVTGFLFSLVPDALYKISSSVLWMRYLPLLAGLAVFLGFVGAASFAGDNARRRGILTGIAFSAVGWSLFESESFVRSGYRSIDPQGDPGAFYRTENVRSYDYVLGGLSASPDAVNGVVDYHLQSRLLRRDDPSREIGDPGLRAADPTLTLTARPDPFDPHWLHLEPWLVLAPGEHQLLRFKFFDRPYSGTLIFRGPAGFYREYSLPNAGFFGKSFGVAPERPKTLALWNSRDQSQPVEMVFYQSELPKDGRPFGDFAEVHALHYDPDTLPVRTLGLIPYRAETTATEAAYLETPRLFIPGYEATVNDRPAAVEASPDHFAMVPVEAGANQVELIYRGTWKLRASYGLSALVWLGLAAAGALRLRRGIFRGEPRCDPTT